MKIAQWFGPSRRTPWIHRNGRTTDEGVVVVGYTSQSAFTAIFRKHFGMPPSAFYRQEGRAVGCDCRVSPYGPEDHELRS